MRFFAVFRQKVLIGICALIACFFCYLLALDSYCDQGGNFAVGICSITEIIPW